MRNRTFVLGLGLCLWALTGCAEDSDTPGQTGGQTDAGADSAIPSGAFTFVVDGTSFELVPEDLQTTTFKDVTVVSLPTLWQATGESRSYNDFVFNFIGSDGFRPEGRDRCANVVFDGAAFEQGYLEPGERNLTWNDDLGYSGCAYVKGLATIEATPVQ